MRSRSLVRSVVVAIAVTSLLTIIAQVVIVAARTYFIEDDMIIAYVTHEVGKLREALSVEAGDIKLRKDGVPAHFWNDGYGFRIVLAGSKVIASHNEVLLSGNSPWADGSIGQQDIWAKNLRPGERLFIAGGRRETIGGAAVLIEVATLGDPGHASWSVLAWETIDDVWMPMIPLFVLTLGAAIVSVRRSLRPLAELSELASHSSQLKLEAMSSGRDLPLEVANFVSVIARLANRQHELLEGQKLFVARAAHELRTPLAALMLEIEQADQVSAAALKADIASLAQMVDRLLTLARLEASETAAPEALNLEYVAEEVVGQIAGLAQQSGHEISLVVNKPVEVVGDANAVHHAMRNLVYNALQHTPRGTKVVVTVGPGSTFSVSDNGPGWTVDDPSRLLEPFVKGTYSSAGTGLGLSIVKRASDMLGGNVALRRAPSGGAKVSLAWGKGSRNEPFS